MRVKYKKNSLIKEVEGTLGKDAEVWIGIVTVWNGEESVIQRSREIQIFSEFGGF